MSKGNITYIVINAVAKLQFSHPKSNAFPSELLQQLIDTIQILDADNDVKIIVLESAGDKTFCAGASFDELLAITNLEDGTKFFSGFANLLNAMRTCSKLIIGRVQGKAVGGGVGIIAACDYTFATEQAFIKLSELSIGIGPFVIAPAIERKIGLSAFSELSLSTNWHTADWAFQKGLYTHVFNDVLAMDITLNDFSNNLATFSKEALYAMKKVLWQNTAHWEKLLYERAAISGRLVLSEETKKALKKFKS